MEPCGESGEEGGLVGSQTRDFRGDWKQEAIHCPLCFADPENSGSPFGLGDTSHPTEGFLSGP